MIGVDRATGQRLDGHDHLAQSIGDILSTPIGTRVMRRDYGSMLTDMIEQPANSITRQLLFAVNPVPLSRWETRLTLPRGGVSHYNRGGAMVIDTTGESGDTTAD